jgi:hypothetical protein
MTGRGSTTPSSTIDLSISSAEQTLPPSGKLAAQSAKISAKQGNHHNAFLCIILSF